MSQKKGRIASHLTLHMGSKDLGKGRDQKSIAKLKREADRALCFLDHKEEGKEVRKILFCGEMAAEVEALLEQEQRLTPVHGDGRGDVSWEKMCRYAIPVGFALDALKNDPLSIQFLQGDYVTNRCIRSLKRKLLYGACTAAALFLLTAIASHTVFSKKEKILLEHVETLAAHYKDDLPKLSSIPLKRNIQEVMEEVHHVLRETKGKENTFATPPLISNLLTFLSTHPLLVDIELSTVDYELKKYPTLEKPKEIYLPRVRIVFKTVEAKKARAFHDAIVENESIVNQSKEIDWKRNNDQYEIAFYLRA